MQPTRPPLEPRAFLKMACLFEGSLAGVALLIGHLVAVPPFEHFSWTGQAISYGMLGTVPLLVVFALGYRLPHEELQRIRRMLIDMMGPLLAACSTGELFFLALLAGIGEEALFRGVAQPWAEQHWGNTGGLLVSNLLFGLAHFVTPLYAVLAALTGLWLGLMLDAGGERNLLTPIVVHAFYDFLAFVLLATAYRSERAGTS
jgi:membrane protease YdiL (CAAX protease family)